MQQAAPGSDGDTQGLVGILGGNMKRVANGLLLGNVEWENDLENKPQASQNTNLDSSNIADSIALPTTSSYTTNPQIYPSSDYIPPSGISYNSSANQTRHSVPIATNMRHHIRPNYPTTSTEPFDPRRCSQIVFVQN